MSKKYQIFGNFRFSESSRKDSGLPVLVKLSAVFLAALLLLTSCSYADVASLSSIYNNNAKADEASAQTKNLTDGLGGILKVHYIDVGQGDSILIQSPDGKNMLIDAGETKDNAVIDYINSAGIDSFDIVVATHPHSDHISEMKSIIESYEIDKFYMPSVSHTSKTFEKMIDALDEKNVNVFEAKEGVKDNLGSSVYLDFMAPCSDYEKDLNNWSAVIMLTFGENKFLFTGDAEEQAEKDILQNNADVSANVLKIGHHGSSTSTSEEFLDAVDPQIAVISCGEDNEYGHPHEETINKLNKRNIQTFITKDNGSVVIKSDGKNIITQ